jgi:hypothetical protein
MGEGLLGGKWLEGYGDDTPGMIYLPGKDDGVRDEDVAKRHALRGWVECDCGAEVSWQRRGPMPMVFSFSIKPAEGPRYEGAVFMVGEHTVDEGMVCAAAAAEALHAFKCGGAEAPDSE